MANICTTSYTIIGTTPAVTRLWETLQQAGAPSNPVSLCDWAEGLGIDYKGLNLYMRGEIWDAQTNFQSGDEYATLFVYTDSAWHGCHEFFQSLGEAVGDELSVSYMEIEPGLEIYCIHDEGGAYDYACYVTASGDRFPETEGPYATFAEAVDTWTEAMGIGRDGRSDEEMRDFINGYEYEDDSYYYIYPFEFE